MLPASQIGVRTPICDDITLIAVIKKQRKPIDRNILKQAFSNGNNTLYFRAYKNHKFRGKNLGRLSMALKKISF